MQIIAESDIGWVGFEGNELTVGSKIDDPAKVRLTAPITEHGGGGGVISFNYSPAGRAVDGHQQTEVGMIRVEQAEDVRGTSSTKAELNFMLADGGKEDSNMRKPLAFIWCAITKSLLSMFGGSAPTDTMWAPSGLFFTQQQADGNFVTYEVERPYDKTASPKALWSAWTGPIA